MVSQQVVVNIRKTWGNYRPLNFSNKNYYCLAKIKCILW